MGSPNTLSVNAEVRSSLNGHDSYSSQNIFDGFYSNNNTGNGFFAFNNDLDGFHTERNEGYAAHLTSPSTRTGAAVHMSHEYNAQIDLELGGHGRVSTNDSYVLYLNHNNGGAQGAESFQFRDGTGNFVNAALIVYENGIGVFNGIVTTTDHINSSGRRYKKNITPLSNSLSNLSLLNGVRYDWDGERWPDMNFSSKHQIGFIAQELEAVYPELVHTDKEGFKSVAYNKMTAVLVETVKELKSEIDELRLFISNLEARLLIVEVSQ